MGVQTDAHKWTKFLKQMLHRHPSSFCWERECLELLVSLGLCLQRSGWHWIHWTHNTDKSLTQIQGETVKERLAFFPFLLFTHISSIREWRVTQIACKIKIELKQAVITWILSIQYFWYLFPSLERTFCCCFTGWGQISKPVSDTQQ